MMKGVASLRVSVVLLGPLCVALLALPSCKDFGAAAKADAAAGDRAEAELGTGGAAAPPGTGGASPGTGGKTPGTGGANGTGSGGSTTGAGGAGCGATQHQCSGTCVDNTSINACGKQCDPCKAPTGGTATCDGSTCDFSCGASMKKCAAASICIAAAGCCTSTDCPMQASGQTGTCDSGTHTCNYGCAANTKACTVGGTTSCLPSSGCCQDSDCAGDCQTCSATTHACVAVVSKDDPNGRCAGTCDAAGACKSKRGQTCKTTTGGCVSGSTCADDGYCCDQACTANCMACDLPGKQGTCTPVPSGPPHGTRSNCTGTGTTCGGACGNRADGACVYPTGNCGFAASCTTSGATGQSTCNGGGACVAPATTACPNGCNATATACLTCAAGQTGCSGTCQNLSTDTQNCGACGQVCLVPMLGQAESGTFGAATCSGSCGYTCNASFMKCPGTAPICQRKTWDFENGTTQGFYQRTDLGALAHDVVTNSTVQHHGGTHSLALPLVRGGTLDLDLGLCSSSSVSLPASGRSLSVWYYVDGPLDTSQGNSLTVGVWGCDSGGSCVILSIVSINTIQTGMWLQIQAPVSAADAAGHPNATGFTFQGTVHPSGSGTVVYVDDVVIQ